MFSAKSSLLPSFKNFQNLNTLIITPPKLNLKNNKMDIDDEYNKNSKGFILNNSQYQEKIKDQLRKTFFAYYKQFEEVCTNIMDSKYHKIYEQIYQFCTREYNKEYLNCLILNTDQNNRSFFQGLAKFLKKKDLNSIDTSTIYRPKGEIAFKDIKKLLSDLNMDNLTVELEEKNKQKTRLLIVGELHKIDNISLSLFLSRLIDYQKQEKPQFNYIIIFDSAFDPRFVFDKIRSNFLSKMIFYSVEIDSSKNVYQEILYDVIYSKNLSLFIPNSDNAKFIVDIINKHQISIQSFKYYFKLLIFQFFLMHNWDDDEYLIFDPLLKGKETEEEIINFFQNKLKYIYGDYGYRYDKKDINNLLNLYKNQINNKRMFFKFYECFEIFLSKLNENSNKIQLFNKYQFFFEFLQYGEESLNINETNEKRANIFISYLKKFPQEELITSLKNNFLPIFKEVLNKIEPFLNENEIQKSKQFSNEINKILNVKEDASLLKDYNIHIIEIKSFLRALMDSFNCFSSINNYDQEEISKKKNRKWINNYLNYLNFRQIVNPYLLQENMNSIIIDICKKNTNQLIKLNINVEDFNFQNTICAYIKCFMRLGSSFKIKLFFAEFLDELQIQINKEKSQIKKIEKAKYIFFYLSYWFVINGFFNKRKGNNELFTKNYYNISNYFNS